MHRCAGLQIALLLCSGSTESKPSSPCCHAGKGERRVHKSKDGYMPSRIDCKRGAQRSFAWLKPWGWLNFVACPRRPIQNRKAAKRQIAMKEAHFPRWTSLIVSVSVSQTRCCM